MSPLKRNPVFWLMWAIPGAAVLAGLSMVAIAMQDADRALPDIYHWEGERLDADFERARQAARLDVQAELLFEGSQCRVRLQGAEPPALRLHLTSGSDFGRDQAVNLARSAAGDYRAACVALDRGKWRVALQDDANTWSLRAQLDQPAQRIELRARLPESGPQP